MFFFFKLLLNLFIMQISLIKVIKNIVTINIFLISIQNYNTLALSKMQKLLINCQSPTKCKIFIKLINQKNLQISVFIQNMSDKYYKQTFTSQKIPPNLQQMFSDTKQLFEHLKQLNPKSIRFLMNKKSSQILQKQPEEEVLINEIQFQVELKKSKVIKKHILLNPTKILSQQTFIKLINQVSDYQKIQQAKKRIQQKQNKIQLLQNQLNQITSQIQQQQKQIENYNDSIKLELANKQKYQLQVRNIKRQYQIKYSGVVKIDNKNVQIKNQQNSKSYIEIPKGQNIEQKGKQNKSQISISKILPSASRIYDAMPSSCQKHPLAKHIEYHNGKCTLFLKSKQIIDKDIHDMAGFDWSSIQILSLGGNKLTNESIQYLNQCGQWLSLNQLYLFANPLTDITKATFLKNLQKLSLYDLQLNEASCDFLIRTQFKQMKDLYLDFDKAVIQKCWKKIADSQLRNFPQLKQISVDNPELISAETRVKLNKVCQNRKIKLTLGNPSKQCQIY